MIPRELKKVKSGLFSSLLSGIGGIKWKADFNKFK